MTGRRPRKLTLEDVVRVPRPGLNVPMRWRFTPDGSALTYLYSERADLVQSLWERPLGREDDRLLAGPSAEASDETSLSLDEALRRERLRMRELGVTDYHFAPKADPRVLAVPSPEGVRVMVGGGDLKLLPGTRGAQFPRLSPNGKRLAFVREGELHVASVATGVVNRLTEGAEPGFTHGLAEFIAQEELERSDGFWWSGDSETIAFEEADSRHIPKFTILHDEGNRQTAETHEYPFAGAENVEVRLGVVALETGQTVWLDPSGGEDGYLANVCWRPDGALIVSWLNREQTTLSVRSFEAPDWTGAPLFQETTEPWLNLAHDIRFLSDGSFVRTSERTGFRHVYLHDRDGSVLRAVTTGDWAVTSLIALDAEQGRVFFQATKESVLERHVYAAGLDGGDLQRLTHEPGWHTAAFDRDCRRFIDTYSSRDSAPATVVRSAKDGRVEEVVFEQPDAGAAGLGLQPPSFIEVSAPAGGVLHGALYLPPGAGEGDEPFPVIVSVYGGPHAQRVAEDWSLTVDLRAQYLAQNGYVVLKLDNRGSANRGLAFEAQLWKRMGTVELEDQVAGVEYLSRIPYADTSRTGIYGWSYGGYMTCLALMKAPEVFSVGVAGAPVADWDGYDTGYTERYMSTPESNPNGYHEASALTHAEGLRGRLMLVHGLVDENVHFRHTVRLVAALTRAQKEYDLLLFPAERHLPRGKEGLLYMERRLMDYFEKHLKGNEPGR